jgi:hypothetical protein
MHAVALGSLALSNLENKIGRHMPLSLKFSGRHRRRCSVSARENSQSADSIGHQREVTLHDFIANCVNQCRQRNLLCQMDPAFRREEQQWMPQVKSA